MSARTAVRLALSSARVLLSRFAYNCAVYGGLVASVTSAWVAIRHRERRVEPKLPPATTGRSFRRYLARIAPVIVLLALLGGEWALLSHAYDAVVIDVGPTAAREVFIGPVPDASTILGPATRSSSIAPPGTSRSSRSTTTTTNLASLLRGPRR